MELYQDQFSTEHDFGENRRPTKTLIIASTPRCGSHMLGHILYGTKQFGFPLEYANPRNVREWNRRLGLQDFPATLRAIQKRRTSPNGVFSIKLHMQHIKAFGDFSALNAFFPDPYFVLLTRNDVLKQAVSLSIAEQTGSWISAQKPKEGSAVYDFEHIKQALRRLILDRSTWRYLLEAYDCNYCELDFSNVLNNVRDSISTVANLMRLEMRQEDMLVTFPTKKQGGKTNLLWRNRFIKDFRAKNDFSLIDPIAYTALCQKTLRQRLRDRAKRLLSRLNEE